MDLFSLWERVLSYIKEENPQYYDKFYRQIYPVSFSGGTFTLMVTEPYLSVWINAVYKDKLERFLSDVSGSTVSLSIAGDAAKKEETEKSVPLSSPETGVRKEEDSFFPAVPDFSKLEAREVSEVSLPSIHSIEPQVSRESLFRPAVSTKETRSFNPNPVNKNNTFDNFVRGNCNDMAFEAALAVAKSAVEPDMAYSSYNPLFIYGPSGLGKTHLLHAICNYVNAARPDLSVLFVSSETFTNELIEAIQSGKNKSFREKYRNLDYLLIDDIQFFGGKKSSSTTEIFNTFNTLFDNKKNIILTSDRTPSDIEELEDRLQTRFSSGLLAHISPPDYEICCAILNKRAEKEKINLPDDVVDYIASHINTSIRELEGAYNKLILFSRVRNIPITFEMAREALAEVIPLDNRHRITVPYIIDVVCDYYNVRKDKLLGNGRPKNIVVPRQIAMYLCRKILNESYPNLRDAFKRKDHSTVLYACERVEKDLQRDPSTVKTIELLKNKIERHG